MVKFGVRVRTWDSLPHTKFCKKNYLKEVYPFGVNLYQKFEIFASLGLTAHIFKRTMLKFGVRVRT